jgi:hypothetical protein
MLPNCIEPFVGRLGCDDCVLPHLQELDERLTHGAIVFDNKNNR